MVGGYQIVDFTDFDLAEVHNTTIKGLYNRVLKLMPLSGEVQHKPYVIKIKYEGNIFTTQNFDVININGTKTFGILLTVLSVDIGDSTLVEYYEQLGFVVTDKDVASLV